MPWSANVPAKVNKYKYGHFWQLGLCFVEAGNNFTSNMFTSPLATHRLDVKITYFTMHINTLHCHWAFSILVEAWLFVCFASLHVVVVFNIFGICLL
jgi:hypothetical protein